MKTLTPRQRAFVDEYLIDLSATKAAIRAGYSARTANEIGSILCAKPHVRAAIDEAMAARSERTQVNADWVLKRLVDEAMADLGDLYDTDGRLLPIEQWPLIWRQGLAVSVYTEELFEGQGKERKQVGISRKVKLSDRIKRIELIGRHVGVKAFEGQVAVKGLDGLADRLERAIARNGR